MFELVWLVNCDVFTGDDVIPNAAVGMRDRRIVTVEDRVPDQHRTDRQVDLVGLSVAPGFIDIQVNGGGNVLFNDDPTVATIRRIVEAHRRFGTTSLYPTYITGPVEGMMVAAAAVSEARSEFASGVLGVHFEGPALSRGKLGVHDGSFARENFPIEVLAPHRELSTLVTVAPEVTGERGIAELVGHGVTVLIGHTNATFEQATNAIAAGARGATHLFNAMTQLTGREPGVVGAFLAHPQAAVDIIADGFHCHFGSIEAAWRAKPRGKCFLVTDAMPPVGGDGSGYELGPWKVIVSGGKCVTEAGVLAGSALDMASAVRNCIQKVGIPRDEALRMGSTYVAEFLGFGENLGYIKPGYLANIVICDNEVRVRGVVLEGEVRWNSTS